MPAGEWRAAFARTFTSTRCSSTGSARSGGKVGIERELDVVGPERELVDGGEHDRGGVDRRERHRQHPGLHAADIEQVGDERREGGEALVGGLDSSARSSGESCGAGGAQAADGRDRGGERAAQVVAHGGQQRGAHLVGLGEDARFARRLGELEVLERRAELGDDHVEEAALRGIQLAAVQLESRRAARASGPTGSRIMRPSGTGSPSVASTVPSASTRRTPVMPNASRVRLTSAGTALSPRRTLPATVASSSASAAARCAIARAAGGLIDDVAHEDRDDRRTARARPRAAGRRS